MSRQTGWGPFGDDFRFVAQGAELQIFAIDILCCPSTRIYLGLAESGESFMGLVVTETMMTDNSTRQWSTYHLRIRTSSTQPASAPLDRQRR